jgi:hypothetical protein
MKYETAKFWQPELADVASELQNGLEGHYQEVDVSVVTCPDLTELGVASSGMCGSTALFEFGGEPYAHNPKYRGANVNIQDMIDASGISQAKAFGAAMADMAVIDGNSGELIPNVDPATTNKSRVARVGSENECIVEHYDSLDCGPIANLFASEGLRDQVLKVDVKTRIGEQASLTQAIRESLANVVGDRKHIGMGGVFQILSGSVKSHVMPNYACLVPGYYDVATEQTVKDFLQFYDHMGPGLLAFCALWTGDPTGGDLNLRVSGEHTHFFHSDDAVQQAGHYHGDNTPEDIHCVGYFSLAEKIFRFGDIYSELGLKP